MDEVGSVLDMSGRRRGHLAALLVTLIAALGLCAPEGAAAAEKCQADYCTTVITEPDGSAMLKIPGGLLRFAYPELKECTWKVEAQYGDGSESGEYVFSEANGLEAKHTYPRPGVYTFDAYATEGFHDGTSEPCPDLHVQATVIYREPIPPVKVPEERGPELPGTSPTLPGGGAAAGLPDAAAVTPHSPYWLACGRGVRSHLTTCRKARGVLAAARDFLSQGQSPEGAAFRAAGFSCRQRGGSAGSISCRRGPQRVLGT